MLCWKIASQAAGFAGVARGIGGKDLSRGTGFDSTQSRLDRKYETFLIVITTGFLEL
jgi:hypothetical protein